MSKETKTTTTYTIEMREDCGGSETITIEASSDEEAVDLAEEYVAEWMEEGEWGIEGAAVYGRYTVTDEDGNQIADDSVLFEIDPDHDAMIRAAGGDPYCDHDWTSEGEGGCRENPGVWSTGGTSMTFRSHCLTCGLKRTEHHTGSQRNPGEHDTVIYEQPDTWCENMAD